MTPAARLCGVAVLIAVSAPGSSCSRFSRSTLVSEEFGFSVTFPEKPIEKTDRNYQGFPRSLWTVYTSDLTEFYSAQATRYKAPLMTEGWVPGQPLGELVGIQLLNSRRFVLRASSTGREAVAIATQSQAPAGPPGYTTYIIDGTTLISVTARTANDGHRDAFLQSLKLLR